MTTPMNPHRREGERQDFARATQAAASVHRERAAAAYDEVLADARVWLANETTEYTFRDALTQGLAAERKRNLNRALTASEMHNVRAAAIGLWGDYARARKLDVRAIYGPMPRVEALV